MRGGGRLCERDDVVSSERGTTSKKLGEGEKRDKERVRPRERVRVGGNETVKPRIDNE